MPVDEAVKPKRGRPAKVKPALTELGTTGLKRQAGFVREEFLQQLIGFRAVQVYKEMATNDPIVGGARFAIDMMMRQVVWRVVDGEDYKAAEDDKKFIYSCLHDMSQTWADTLSEILSFLIYGWSYHEIVYKLREGPEKDDASSGSKFTDGKVGWKKLPIRSQDSFWEWKFDDHGGIKGMTQNAPPYFKPVVIPIEKALLFRTTSEKGNPEGRSVLRNAYRPWVFKKRIEEIEGIGVERDLAGLPVVWVPPDLLQGNKSAEQEAAYAEFMKMIVNIRRDEQEGVIMPLAWDENGNKLYDLTLLTTGGTRQFDTDVIIGRYNRQIAMSMLADFILLGHEKVGSFALSGSKMELFAVALGAWLDSICGVFNSYGIPRLAYLNGMDLEKLPVLQHGPVTMPDLDSISNYLAKMSGAGMPMFPDEDFENHLRDVAHLPRKGPNSPKEAPPRGPIMGRNGTPAGPGVEKGETDPAAALDHTPEAKPAVAQ